MNKAFTLVELAIVIVIIGLLVGGVLQGQELIKQARLRDGIKKMYSVHSAYNTFRAKYNAIPGDFNRAVTMIGGADTANGNGNNKVEWNTVEVPVTIDNVQFWHHLQQAKILQMQTKKILCGSLVACQYADFWDRNTIAFVYWKDLYLASGLVAPPMGNAVMHIASHNAPRVDGAALTPEEAWSIDDKIDDGKPSTGLFVSKQGMAGSNPIATNCLSSTEYNIAEPAINCRALYLID